MSRNLEQPSGSKIGLVLLLPLLLASMVLGQPATELHAAALGEEARITILVTTDVHGNIWPYDYLEAEHAARGLARVSTYAKQVRHRQPNTLLVDCGDTFQGTPLAYRYAVERTTEPNPVVAAMNTMGYDAMATGNHEWNFGLPVLWRLKEQAQFPILGANIQSSYHDRVRDYLPTVIRRIGGVRVALLGMVTPMVSRWDPPDHWVGYQFRDLVETAREVVPQLREKADVVVLLVHSGLGRDPRTGEREAELFPEENQVWDIAEQVPGIDVILYGHSHRELSGTLVNGVLLLQPKNWAQSVGEVELVVTQEKAASNSSKMRWRVKEKQGRLVPMDDSVSPDPEILDLTRGAHEETERWLNTVLGESTEEVSGEAARVDDTALVDLIHRVQLEATGAEVSLAGIFSTRTRWPAGPLTIRDVFSLYFYDNKLLSVEINGAQLKQALEYAAGSFRSYPWPAGSSPFEGGPYARQPDNLEGVTYKIDLRRPPGERIMELEFEGAPLDPQRRLRLALNSYVWSGGSGYEMLRQARPVDRVEKEVRALIIDYLDRQKKFVPQANHNWEIVPAEARQAALEWVGARSAASVPRLPPISATSRDQRSVSHQLAR